MHGDKNAECEQRVRDLGGKTVMVMYNHSTLVVGRTVGEAFLLNRFFERACRTQIDALASGREILEPAPGICAEIS